MVISGNGIKEPFQSENLKLYFNHSLVRRLSCLQLKKRKQIGKTVANFPSFYINIFDFLFFLPFRKKQKEQKERIDTHNKLLCLSWSVRSEPHILWCLSARP